MGELLTPDPTAAFFAAVEAGDLESARRQLEAGPSLAGARNAAGDSPLLVALYHGRREMADLLRRAGAAVSLFEAAALGDRRLVEGHLERDPDLARGYSHDGWTALHLASFFGHGEIAALLIDRGADVNARSQSPCFAKENTPLHAAAANRQTAVAELLIGRGADVNARDGSGFTPLGLAANSKNDLLVIRLLELGAQAT